ncbi:hypothetical protein GH5_03300 [Leishmania sp. Ghana 2012 LV757]|uniref:hypothetical protein n=1 Tax=Leishmania sp. Ghana 2012 LV757 TaxID=2803181 RepID=UPI001B5502B7|nr:hypothetical protein GH5_03300 [Leishmania sp. Ghana 2012 LV757]
MAAAVRRYSLANPPPVEGELSGHETAHEAEILELQALQAERDGEGGRSVLLMERALQIRCRLVNQLQEKCASIASGASSTSSAGAHRMSVLGKPDAVGKEELFQEYQAQCSGLYDAAERLVVRCNELGVDHFKRDAFAEASPLLEYAMQLTEDDAYPLCEVEERRRHLRGVTLNNLGCMERRRGHFSEALQYMKSSMEMTGVESPVAYMNTSAILIQLRLSDEAVRMAERSIELLYQTPEDPSLLAVAHHNLAMALEPVDPARCLEEYALAYRTACSTLGPESETTRSIQRSWRRYEMTRVSRPTAPFFTPSGGAAASHLREFAGAAPIRHAATAPHRLPATLPPQTRKGKSGRANGPMDVMELFPHPFLPCSTAPSAPAGAQRNVTPIYCPTALPRRSPVPEWKPGVTAALSSRSRVPDSQSHQQRRQNGTEKVLRPSPPASRAAAATTRQSPANRANEAAAASSGRVATATTPSPPPSRQRDAVASRRYSRATRAQEPLLQSPLRTGTRQQDFSVKKSTMTASSTADMPVKRENSASRYVHGRLTVQATPTALSTFAAQPPGRGSLLTARENGNGKPSTTLPPPRNLPPLQAAAALELPAVAPRRSCTRSSRSVAASEPLPPTSAPFSLESDPLSFLQNRLEVLLQDEEELEHKYLHATVIQRYYRGHLGRRRVAALRATRASYGRLAQLRRNMAARRIQRAFRRHHRDSRYPLAGGRLGRYAAGRGWRGVQHHAATQLQRIARSWLARRRYAQLRKYALKSPLAASRIQRWIRALLARRRYAALRAEKAHEEAEALELERRQYAATRIQSQWLTHLQRRACKAALCNRMMARAAEDARRRMSAAIRIQSAWRGHQARQLYRDTYSRTFKLRRARLEHERRRHAAVKLQSFGRMLITKQQAMPLLTAARVRAAAEIQTRSREGRAATTIQCAYRSHVARRVCATKRARRRELICQGLLQVHTAAVQRAGRGFLARRSVGVKLSALQTEADRYERLLQALQGHELETARTSQHVREPHLYAIRDSAIDERGVLELAEQQQRHRLRRQCSASLPAATKPPAAQKLWRDIFSPPLHDFTLIIKAKQQRADRSRARDDYLDRCTADDAEAHEKASARVIADFMLSAAARKELLAAEADASAPERPLTAEQIAGERKELDRLARKELLAAEADASAPERPLTAEQIAGERKELDRLARKELLAAEADASAPERPLTAEQIAEEREELDRLARQELLAAETDASAPERPLTAEQIAEEREELDRLARQELLAAETDASAPERPLTAEQIAEEREELDRLARQELLAAETDASAPERPLTAEQIAEEREELDRLARQELLAAETDASAPERPLTAEQIAEEREELDRLARQELLAAETDASAPERPLTAEQIAEEREELDRLARQELLAAETDASAPERPLTAEQIAEEREELDRLARQELLAAEADASAPERPLTAEQIAGERKELDRLARKELLAAEADASAPERPLTAEQIAGERKELDRLARKELLAAEADASAPERPLTAEQIAGEREELDRLARQELLAAETDASAPERPLTAEQIAEEREELDRLARQELLAAETDASAPERPLTAEQIAEEREELDRLARQELLAAETDASAPERPLTAEQIAEEREELDRLARKELLAAEADASAPERPLTAEQIAEEREELDRLARQELLAAETDASAPERPLTAEQIAEEREELDRLARQELLAAETDASAPERPLTAEQIAEEREELDRLARQELLAAETDASAPERPLTAEQIAEEREELDRLARQELLRSEGADSSDGECVMVSEKLSVSSECSVCTSELACEMLARKKAVWQAEVCAERRHREKAEALHRAAFDYRQQRIFIAEEEADLAPFRMQRSRLEKPARGEKGNASAVAAGSSESSAGKHRPERAALERAAVWCIERYFIGWWDRKFLTALQRMRDEYLNAMQEFELHDGPVLTNVRLREVLARYPDLRTGAKQSATSGSPSGCLKVVNCRPSCWTLAAWRSRKTLRSFARLIKAKQQRADRSRARDDYLDRCTADDAEAHEKASARVIADFMLSAAARSTLLRRAETMSAYNDARVMQEEVERESMPQRLAEQQVVAERLALGQLGYLAMPTECWKPCRADRTEQTASSDAALRAQKIKDARSSTDAGRTSTSSSSRPLDSSEQETLSSGEARGRLCVFAMTVRDKRDLRQRQAARDAYLQDMRDESTSGTDEEMEHDKRLPTSSAGARTWTRAGETVCSDVTGMVDHEAMLQLYCQERRLFASSLLGGFTRIIKAKQQRADRSRARDDYLDRCTADDAEAHEKASARVIADFMLSAAARSTLLRRAETMSAYNDARVMQEEVEGAVDAVAEFSGEAASEKYSELPQLPRAASPAVRRIQRFVRGVQARVHLRALQEACSAYLEEELAVEELLYSAALTIQRMFRCHLARRQAAEAIAQGHACLPSHKEERRSADGGLGALGHDALSSEVLSLFAPSSKGVVSGGAESVATSALSPRRASSTLSVGVRELTSTALVTVVNEAKEAVRD